ncbi:hypothetical protein CLV96_3948 [Leptospira meyeri]|uniref:Uncharacterized protein n=1 Tax=Leptospira meyeri TaxID=29508 RepID=A0A4R8MIS9_LEPME|nr:hypothetical protein [Leptospira meyeri]EKJ86104.1 putative membrane protein [Leptospira meyeri serovar Hardjo str. Went 5]TDY66378.1 hypothetical protein CLV96_3948 [Leptospira meyeri]
MKKILSKILIFIFIFYPIIFTGSIIYFYYSDTSDFNFTDINSKNKIHIIKQLISGDYKEHYTDNLRTDFILKNLDEKVNQIIKNAKSYAVLNEKRFFTKKENLKFDEEEFSILFVDFNSVYTILHINIYSFENEIPKFNKIEIQQVSNFDLNISKIKDTKLSFNLAVFTFLAILFYLVSLYGILGIYKNFKGEKPWFIFIQFLNIPAIGLNLKTDLIALYLLNFGLFPLSILKYGLFGDWQLILRFPIFSIFVIFTRKLFLKEKNGA